MTKWIEEDGPLGNIVISSRIRLARNLDEYPFPIALNKERAREVIKKVSDAILEGNTVLKTQFNLLQLEKMTVNDRRVLMEKHLISPNLADRGDIGGVLIDKDEGVSIMINEEDHLRIQCLLPGFQLKEAYDLADKIDDILEESLKYAFDEKLGYLTSCPTNLGTGIRASVMVHLPALAFTGYIERMLQAVTQIGLTVRGLYGEGTESQGNLFQISNQVTLGSTEEEIINTLIEVTKQIVEKEREVRENLIRNNRRALEDKLSRSFGILKYAKLMSSHEALNLLSDLRLAVDLGIIKNIDTKTINKLMIEIQPGMLQKICGRDLNANERDVERAILIGERLKNF